MPCRPCSWDSQPAPRGFAFASLALGVPASKGGRGKGLAVSAGIAAVLEPKATGAPGCPVCP